MGCVRLHPAADPQRLQPQRPHRRDRRDRRDRRRVRVADAAVGPADVRLAERPDAPDARVAVHRDDGEERSTEINACDAPGWFGEQSLDVEAVHAAAPGAHILYMGAKNCSTNALNRQLEKVVDGHLASIVSNSYGDDGGDVLDDPSDRIATDNILEMAAGTGVSALFSSGDDGDEFTTDRPGRRGLPGVEPVGHGGRRHQPGGRPPGHAVTASSAGRPRAASSATRTSLRPAGLHGQAGRPVAADRPRARRRRRRRHQRQLPAAVLAEGRGPEVAVRGQRHEHADACRARHLDGRRPGDRVPRGRDADVPRRRVTTTSTGSAARACPRRCSPACWRAPTSWRASRPGS